MVESKVARRYARSLLVLAQERNLTEKVFADMQLVAKTCEHSADLVALLRNPIINTDKKESILKAVFGPHIDPLTFAFMELMARKGRESYLYGIAMEFISTYKASIGIQTAYVTSAIALDAATREQVLEIIRKTKGSKVELIEKVDKELLGGFILRVGDEQFDASISKKLNQLKTQFDDNLYVREI
ncbi:ATP synthase F1 subunit delta [soil metagenome]